MSDDGRERQQYERKLVNYGFIVFGLSWLVVFSFTMSICVFGLMVLFSDFRLDIHCFRRKNKSPAGGELVMVLLMIMPV